MDNQDKIEEIKERLTTGKEARMFKEFREFAMRGNVLDLAVGVIIGGAFGKIVTSLVNDVIMPVIGFLFGGHLNFTDFFWVLNGASYANLQEARDAGAPVFAYGAFITTIIDFVIVAFIIFLIVKGANSLRRKQAETPPAPAALSKEAELLTEIRDLLQKQNR
jgi:large conductance mechanosensitive channel